MAKPTVEFLTAQLTEATNDAAAAKAEATALKQKLAALTAQVSFLLGELKDLGPLRQHTEDCPGLEVGVKVMTRDMRYGRVSWTGHGGGVWKGQQLCLIEGSRDVIPTMDAVVVDPLGDANV